MLMNHHGESGREGGSLAESAVAAIERADVIDRSSRALRPFVSRLVGDGVPRDLATGRWLGHPVHPAAVTVPLACWFGSTVLDLVGGRDARGAARRLVGLGVVGAFPVAATGAADWLDTADAEQRVRHRPCAGDERGSGDLRLVVVRAAPGPARQRGGAGRRRRGGHRSRRVPRWAPCLSARRRRRHHCVPGRARGLDGAAPGRRRDALSPQWRPTSTAWRSPSSGAPARQSHRMSSRLGARIGAGHFTRAPWRTAASPVHGTTVGSISTRGPCGAAPPRHPSPCTRFARATAGCRSDERSEAGCDGIRSTPPVADDLPSSRRHRVRRIGERAFDGA